MYETTVEPVFSVLLAQCISRYDTHSNPYQLSLCRKTIFFFYLNSFLLNYERSTTFKITFSGDINVLHEITFFGTCYIFKYNSLQCGTVQNSLK